MPEDKLSSSTPIIYQILLRKLGAYGSSSLGNDIYYLKEFVDIFIQDFGEEKVIEMLKNDTSSNSKRCKELAENWKDFKTDWRYFDRALNRAKGYFDKIENKDFSKISEDNVRDFGRYARYVPLIKEDLYTLVVFFIRNSPIQKKTIPLDAWKVLEHSHLKKIDAGRRPPKLIEENKNEAN